MPAPETGAMLAGTYTAFAPIGRFQMLSREKGQRVATRPVADADAEEPDEESRADGPPASADSEVLRRIPVKTNARTINELRLRLGGRRNEERMPVARGGGIGVTVGGCLVTSGCVYSGDCTSIESGYRAAEYARPVVHTPRGIAATDAQTNPSLNFVEKA